ncbi:MAG: glycosyltransferase family 87 protein [Verrucomicrobiota bacterium]
MPIVTLSWYWQSGDDLVLENGNVLGGDFIAFYMGGLCFVEDSRRLYDASFQKEVRDKLFRDSGKQYEKVLPYVYPPLVAAGFALLTNFSYSTAFYIYLLVSVVVGVGALLWLVIELGIRTHGWYWILALIAGFFPFSMNTLMGGQISWLGMAMVSVVIILLRRGFDFSAGVLVSLSYYKPPLFLFLLVVLLICRGISFLKGFLVGGVVLVGTSFVFVGWEGCLGFLQAASGYTYGQELPEGVELDRNQGAGVYGLLTVVLGKAFWAGLALMLLFGLALIATYQNRPKVLDSEQANLWFAWVIMISVGLSIQCIRYDLAILLPVVLLSLPALDRLLPRRLGLLVALGITGFYVEWMVRWSAFSGLGINLSSILFIVCGLVWALVNAQLRKYEIEKRRVSVE